MTLKTQVEVIQFFRDIRKTVRIVCHFLCVECCKTLISSLKIKYVA